MEPRTVVARWIEEQREERDAPALAWLMQRAAFALIGCFAAGEGKEVLWGLFRSIAGTEQGTTGKRREPSSGRQKCAIG